MSFPITITAYDAHGNVATGFTGPATLSDTTGTVSPTVTSNFVNGLWTGNITITGTGDNIVITVRSGLASGTSNSFEVVASAPPPRLIYLPIVIKNQ